jgi:hypothetical protein
MESDISATWNPALEQIIRKEGEQSQAMFWLHNKASVLAGRRNDWLQIPAIVLSTVTGFLSATTNLVPMLALGSISVLVGILGTLNSYFKYSQKSEQNRLISLMYLKIYKTIEVELALPANQRTDATMLLKELRQSMNQIGEQAPIVPENVISMFKLQFKDGTTSVPTIANGLDTISVYKGSLSLPSSPSITTETQTRSGIHVEIR